MEKSKDIFETITEYESDNYDTIDIKRNIPESFDSFFCIIDILTDDEMSKTFGYAYSNISYDNYKMVKGINDGGTVGFVTVDGILNVYNKALTSLEIPDDIKIIICSGNKLTELDIPPSVKYLYCDKSVKNLMQYNSRENLKIFAV